MHKFLISVVVIMHVIAVQAMQPEQFKANALRLQDYLGRPGHVLYVSRDLNNYLEVDATGNKILDSSNAQLINRELDANLDEHTWYRHPQGIEVYRDSEGKLQITYPSGIKVRIDNVDPKRYVSILDDRFTYEDSMGRVLRLHSAIDKLNPREVKFILGDPSDLSKIVNYQLHGDTALTKLMKRAMKGTQQELAQAQDIIRELVNARADLFAQDSQGNTPMRLAAGNRVLLEVLSDSRLNQLLSAYQRGDAGAAQTIVTSFAPVLQLNINRLDSARVRKLLNTINKADNTKQITENLVNFKVQGDTALHTAAKRALQLANDQQFEAIKEIIQMLLGAGADPTILNDQDKLPMMVLIEAPGIYEIQLIKLFMQASGRALFDAIARADIATVENVLNAMQKRGNAAHVLNSMTNDAGQTPLIYVLSLAQATNDPARKQQLLYSAQYLVNAGATLEQQPQAREQFSNVIQFLTGL